MNHAGVRLNGACAVEPLTCSVGEVLAAFPANADHMAVVGVADVHLQGRSIHVLKRKYRPYCLRCYSRVLPLAWWYVLNERE